MKVENILNEFSTDQLSNFFNGTPAIRRKILLNVIQECTIWDNVVSITFITGRKVKFNVKNKPAWLLAQEDSLRTGVYGIDYINYIRNRNAENWETLNASTIPIPLPS